MSLQLLSFCVGILYNHEASTGIFTPAKIQHKVMPSAALVSGYFAIGGVLKSSLKHSFQML